MATFPSSLQTQRLHLQRLSLDDADDVFSYASDPEVTRFLTFPTAKSLDNSTSFIENVQSLIDSGNEMHWAIRVRETNAFVGVVTLFRSSHGLEVGYVTSRNSWGNGYMIEVVNALKDWAFNVDNTFRFWATCHVRNERSAGVLQRVGMQEEGILRNWLVRPNQNNEADHARVFSILPG